MLLDALMAASDRLIVTYAGNDVRTNAPRPPAVPVGELLDVIDRTVAGRRPRAGARPPSAPALRPAQLHARRAGRRRAVELRPRHARRRPRDAGRARRAAAVPAPARSRPRPCAGGRARGPRRLRPPPGARVPAPAARASASATYADEVDDALPIELDNLESWQIGQRMLDARLAGATRGGGGRRRSCARGALPPGKLAEPVIDKLLPDGRGDLPARRGAAPASRRAGVGRRARRRSRTAGG